MRSPSVYGQPLTAGQLAALRLAAEGYTSAQIATRLGSSEAGVHRRFKEIAIRLGSHSRTHSVVIALRRGLIHFDDLDLDQPRSAA